MQLTTTPEQEMMRSVARGFLADRVPTTRVRSVMGSDPGFDEALWKDMAAQGWQATAVPEEYGGAGFALRELALLMEEMGAVLAPVPFLSSVVLATNAVLIGGTEDQRNELLPLLASGERRAAVALCEPESGWAISGLATTAAQNRGSWRITGEKTVVVDGDTAGLLLVPAAVEDGTTEVFVVDPTSAGTSRTRVESLDPTRPLAALSFDGAAAVGRLGGPGTGQSTLERLLDVAAALLAAEQVGGAQRCLDMAVDHARNRIQFGRPIGSFQAVKHKCVDMLVHVESARSAASYAAVAVDGDAEDGPIAAATAKVRCSDAFFAVAAETIQVLGGIGFTWEHDAHLYFKRAKADQMIFGGPHEWRARLGDRLGL